MYFCKCVRDNAKPEGCRPKMKFILGVSLPEQVAEWGQDPRGGGQGMNHNIDRITPLH